MLDPAPGSPESLADRAAADLPPDPPEPTVQADPPLPWWGFAAAVVGRLWLSLVTGMLLISTVPALLPGWSAHVVVSDSMAPRINAGDVVLSQQRDDYAAGQVIVFDDESRGAVTHRIESVAGDSYTTKGDANVTADSSPVASEDVIGLGRLLVMFAGLPWVWYHTGQWLPLVLFLASLLLAAWAIARDRPAGDDEAGTPGEEDPGAGTRAEDGAASGASEPHAEDPVAAPELAVLRGAVTSVASFPGPLRAPTGIRRARRWLPTTILLVGVVALLASTLPSASAGFTASTGNAGNVWRAATLANYRDTVLADNPYLYLRLNEAQPANNPATLTAAKLGSIQRNYQYTRATGATFAQSFTLGSPASANLTPPPNTSAAVLRDNACILAPNNQGSLNNPTAFSIEAWIRSTGTAGGKIIGFESRRTGTSSQYDRHLYQDSQGYVHFGVYNNNSTAVTIRSAAPLNDGNWHHVMGTISGAGGTMRLYVDGAEVTPASPVAGVTAEAFTGWWRVGCGNLSGWPTGTPALTDMQSFIGSIDEPAVYLQALTAADAAERWAIGRP